MTKVSSNINSVTKIHVLSHRTQAALDYMKSHYPHVHRKHYEIHTTPETVQGLPRTEFFIILKSNKNITPDWYRELMVKVAERYTSHVIEYI